jgi:hypothetical protein
VSHLWIKNQLKKVLCAYGRKTGQSRGFVRTLTTEFNKDNSVMALKAVLVTER